MYQKISDSLGKTAGVVFTATIFIFIGLLVFLVLHDYVFVTLYEIAENMSNSGFLNPIILNSIENLINNFSSMLVSIDVIWFLTFIIFIIELFYNSYHSQRLGHFSYLTMSTFGVLLIMFVSSIVYQIAVWFKFNFIDNLLSSVSGNIPLFTWYFNNFGWFNLIIIGICLFLNNQTFDFSKFNLRKGKGQSLDDEI